MFTSNQTQFYKDKTLSYVAQLLTVDLVYGGRRLTWVAIVWWNSKTSPAQAEHIAA